MQSQNVSQNESEKEFQNESRNDFKIIDFPRSETAPKQRFCPPSHEILSCKIMTSKPIFKILDAKFIYFSSPIDWATQIDPKLITEGGGWKSSKF